MDLSKRLSENMIIHDVLQREKEKIPKGKVDYRSLFQARLAVQMNIFF